MFNYSFSSKAKRGEYWKVLILWFITIGAAALFITYKIATSINTMSLSGGEIIARLGGWIFPLVIIGICGSLAGLAVTVRRCNDIGMNPFWSLLTFVPYIGFAAILLFGTLSSNDTPTKQDMPKNDPIKTTQEDELKYLLNIKTQETPSSEDFFGEKDLSNDSYKLFLAEKYAIKKNEVFDKFVTQEKLFNSIDDALDFSHSEEIRREKEVKEQAEKLAYEELEKQLELEKRNESWTRQLKEEERLRQEKWVADEPRRLLAAKKKKVYICLITICLLIGAIGGWKFYEHKTSYSVFRESIQSEGWRPLVRPPPIAGWSKPFPEVFYCDEGYCFADFINKSKPKLVRTISYEYCGHPYGGKCLILNAEGFLRTYSDELISRKKSDERFESIRRNMEKY